MGQPGVPVGLIIYIIAKIFCMSNPKVKGSNPFPAISTKNEFKTIS